MILVVRRVHDFFTSRQCWLIGRCRKTLRDPVWTEMVIAGGCWRSGRKQCSPVPFRSVWDTPHTRTPLSNEGVVSVCSLRGSLRKLRRATTNLYQGRVGVRDRGVSHVSPSRELKCAVESSTLPVQSSEPRRDPSWPGSHTYRLMCFLTVMWSLTTELCHWFVYYALYY